MQDISKELKSIVDTLESIDVSLQLIACKSDTKRTSAFVSKRVISKRLSMPSVAIDKLIHQGIISKGQSGLVEGKHYCKLDPRETNSSRFLYDPLAIIHSAWSNFQNV